MPTARHAFTAMTFNVRYDDEWDETHRWADRRDAVVEVIRAHRADLLALQEPTPGQREDLVSRLPDLAEFDGGFVRPSRFDMLERGTFALPGPGEPRACAWVRVRDRVVDRMVLFASAHVDTAESAWQPSAVVLHEHLDAIAADTPIVLAGDFNVAAGSAAHRALLGEGGFRDTWYEAGRTDERAISYHGFTGTAALPSAGPELERFLDATLADEEAFAHYRAHVCAHHNYRIDWILIRGGLSCAAALIDTQSAGRVLPSDHYPVVASLVWQ